MESVFDRDRRIRAARLTMAQTFYLVTLNQFVGQNSDAWPSQTTIANAMNTSVRTVRRCQQDLEQMEVIQVEIGCGRAQTNRYRMDLSQLPVNEDTVTGLLPSNEDMVSGFTNGNEDTVTGGMRTQCPVNEDTVSYRKIIKEQEKEQSSASTKTTRNSYPQHFEEIWHAYPKKRRQKKRETWGEYQAAIKRVMESRAVPRAEAQSWMLQRVQEFAASYLGSTEPAAPFRWFKNDRFEDSPESWGEFNGANGTTAGEFGTVQATVLQIYSPDLRNTSDVEAALTPEQFQAVKTIGLGRVASKRGDQRALAAEYAEARRTGA